MKINDIVLIGMMSAILLAVQVSFSFLPNIELASLLIILFTLHYKRKTLFIIYIFALLEGVIYGFHIWFINYLYIWTILYFLVRLIRKNSSPVFWAIVSGIYGLSFGALCSIPYFFIGGPEAALAYWVNGIPFDIIHGPANFVITLVLFHPLDTLLKKIDIQRNEPNNSLNIY